VTSKSGPHPPPGSTSIRDPAGRAVGFTSGPFGPPAVEFQYVPVRFSHLRRGMQGRMEGLLAEDPGSIGDQAFHLPVVGF
jgi:hypothetical protein